MRDFIPQIEPWIDESELEQLKRVVDSTFVTENSLTKEFEQMIKDLHDKRNCCFVLLSKSFRHWTR